MYVEIEVQWIELCAVYTSYTIIDGYTIRRKESTQIYIRKIIPI